MINLKQEIRKALREQSEFPGARRLAALESLYDQLEGLDPEKDLLDDLMELQMPLQEFIDGETGDYGQDTKEKIIIVGPDIINSIKRYSEYLTTLDDKINRASTIYNRLIKKIEEERDQLRTQSADHSREKELASGD